MPKNYCTACGAELIPGKEFCPKCLVRVSVMSQMQYPADTPENRAKKMKEYKVVGQEDRWLHGGRFDKFSMEQMLNSYGREGWEVKAIATSKTVGMFLGTERDEMLVILERDMPLTA